MRAVARHGDLDDAQTTAKILEVPLTEKPVRIEKFRVSRREFHFAKCPFKDVIAKCRYSVAQVDGDPVVRGNLQLRPSRSVLCISPRDVRDILGTQGKVTVPVPAARGGSGPAQGSRTDVLDDGNPYDRAHGVIFELAGTNRLRLAVTFYRTNCAYDVWVLQNQ
jgi:hypothetical protein